jgi:protease I
MKKVVLIVAPNDFRDEEYYKTKNILEKNNINTSTSSLKIGTLNGTFGFKAKSSILIQNINHNDFDAIIYIGGKGSNVFFKNMYSLKLAKIFFKQKKITAAICISPIILANSGILKNKKATVFIDGKESITNSGAIYTGNNVEIDQQIVTANGPESSELFATSISQLLK